MQSHRGAGCAGAILIAQVVVKRVQLGAGPPLSVIRSILRADGWRGFYRGLAAAVATSAPASALWWPAYESAKHALAPLIIPPEKAGEGARWHALHAVSGACASLAAVAATNPLDIIKTRLQTGSETYGARGVWGALVRVAAREGVRGLQRGLGARLAYTLPSAAFSTMAYELTLRLSRI